MTDDKKAAVIRDAQAILADALADVITNDEAITRLLRLLASPRAREALKDGAPVPATATLRRRAPSTKSGLGKARKI